MPGILNNTLRYIIAEVYSEPTETPKMELFAKIVDGF